MKLSDLKKLMNSLPPTVDINDPQQRNAHLKNMGFDPGGIYQELEMESRFVDTHRDVSFAGAPLDLHSHDFYEILYCSHICDVEYLVGAERYRLQKGDIVMIPPGTGHRPLLREDMSEPYSRIVLWINADFMENFRTTFPELFGRNKWDRLMLRTAGTPLEFLGELFENGLREAQSGKEDSQLMLVGNTITLLGQIRRAFLDRETGTMKAEKPELLDRVLAYVEEHLARKVSLADVAKYFYVSESTISQSFRKKMGVSFYHFVNQRRLIAAKTLIQQGNPMEEVGQAVGFADYSTFYRAFKKEYGISPRQFRKMQAAAE